MIGLFRNFFTPKYTISLLNSKWSTIERNLKMTIVPRKDEFVYLGDKYYRVITVVHTNNKFQDIFVIVEEMSTKLEI